MESFLPFFLIEGRVFFNMFVGVMKRWFAIFFSGALWLAIGSHLLWKGLRLIVYVEGLDSVSLIRAHKKTALIAVSFALLVGFIKGRFLLIKSVKRIVMRIFELSEPISILKIYHVRYLFLICLMISLGVLMSVLSLPALYRGLVDVAIGSALIFGSLLFFRISLFAKKARD